MARGKNDLRRRKPTKPRRAVIWIFTDGKNTERDYLQELSAEMKVSLHFAPECVGRSPTQLAESACQARRKAQSKRKRGPASDSEPDYQSEDQFWCVFDHDDRHDFNSAWRRCQDATGIGTATSNPCFEVWLILHKEDFNKPDNQEEVQRHLESICESYCRTSGKAPDLSEFLPEVETAEKRAEKQFILAKEDGELGRRPSTEVFKLVRAIRNNKPR